MIVGRQPGGFIPVLPSSSPTFFCCQSCKKERYHSLPAGFIRKLWGDMRKLIFIACAATVIAAGSARAADDAYATQTVSEFLAICQNDIKQCDGDVNAADSMAMLQSIGDPSRLGYCEPDNVSEEDRGKVVVNWLTHHPEMASEKFLAGADAAFRAIWPCH
jgi:Rap1a immunity proteins